MRPKWTQKAPLGCLGRLLGVSWGVRWGLLGRLGVLRRVSESWGVLWGLLGRLGVLRRLSVWLSGVFWGSHGVSWVAFGLRVVASLAK